MNECKHFHTHPTCLLKQLADGTASLDTAKCEQCQATLEELDVNFSPLANESQPTPPRKNSHEQVVALADQLWESAAVSSAEQRASQTSGLRMRCPHCASPVELSADQSLSHLDCSSCGEPFRLIDDSETVDVERKNEHLGHFRLIEQVGAGSFGAVWRAHDTELDRSVAIKIPRRENLSSRDIEKFVHEARASAALNHPNIVSVHEIGREQNSVFIVSDFVDGLTLADYLTGQLLTAKEAARLCSKIADALHHAHEQGVVHRDLKPGNIGVDHHLNPFIMDFGLALRGSTEMTMTTDGKILGTPAYMSPEQARGDSHTADRRSDIYSLGVMLFEMLTGERPFRGNVRMLLHQITHEEPPNPQRLNAAIPRDLATICLKCLEKSPERRYQHASALRDDFERFLDGHPITARSISSIERGWRWCKRNPLPSALIFLLVGSLIAGTSVSSWKWIEASRNARVAELTASEKQQQSAELLFERGQQLCEAGNIGEGLNWMGASLRSLPESDSPESWRSAILSNLHAWHAVAPKLRHRLQLPESVRTVACSPTEDLLVTGGMEGVVRRFDLNSGALLGVTEPEELYAPSFAVQSIEFHPSGHHFLVTRAATTSEVLPGTLTRVDAKTGQRVETLFKVEAILTDSAYSPAASVIAVIAGKIGKQQGKTWLLDAETGDVLGEPIDVDFKPWSVLFTRDGGALLVSGARNVLQIDVESREVITLDVMQTDPLQETNLANARSMVTWHPDGSQLITTREDSTTRIWEYPSLEPGESVAHSNVGASVSIHPAGTRLLVSDWSGHTQIVDVHASRLMQTQFRAAGESVETRTGEQMVSYSNRDVEIWDLPLRSRAAKKQPLNLEEKFREWRASISPSGNLACVGTTTGLARLIDPTTNLPMGAPMHHLLPNVGATIFSADGKMVATSCRSYEDIGCFIRLWDAASGAALSDWIIQDNWVTALDFSPDGTALASADYAGRLTIWNVASLKRGTPARKATMKCGDVLVSIAFSPDGATVVAGSADSWSGAAQAHLMDATTGERIGEPMHHDDWASSVEFSPDGSRLLTVSPDGYARVWSATTTELQASISFSASLGLATFSPDGQTVLTGSSDGTVQLWHAADGKPVTGSTLKWPDDTVTSLAFSPDGNQFAVGFASGKCQLCERVPFTRIGPPRIMRSSPLALRFTSGSNDLVGVSATAARQWHIDEPSPEVPIDQLLSIVEADTRMRFDPAAQTVVDVPWPEWAELRKTVDNQNSAHMPIDANCEERLSDAIEDDNHFATDYYAQRLLGEEIKLRAWKRWQLQATQAAMRALNQDFEAATSAYEAISEANQGSTIGNALEDWYRQQAAAATTHEHWALARWYLTKLIALQEGDWTLYRDRAHVFSKLGELELRQRDVEQALEHEPGGQFLVKIAEERAKADDWQGALELFELAHPQEFTSSAAMANHLITALMVDPDRTRSVVTRMLDFAESRTLTLGMTRVITVYASYGRIDAADSERVLALSDRTVDTFREQPALQGAELLQRGLLLVRVGRVEEAIEALETGADLIGEESRQRYLLGMAFAHAYNGDTEEAQAKVDQMQPEAYRQTLADFWTRHAWDALMRELESLGVRVGEVDSDDALLD